MWNTDCEAAVPRAGGAHPSTKIFLEQVAINNILFINIFFNRSSWIFLELIAINNNIINNNILEEEPCSRSTILTSCDESQRPRPQGSGGSSPEQKEDSNLGQVRRPFGLSKEGLGAKGGEEEGGQNWRIQSNFFIVKASCISE